MCRLGSHCICDIRQWHKNCKHMLKGNTYTSWRKTSNLKLTNLMQIVAWGSFAHGFKIFWCLDLVDLSTLFSTLSCLYCIRNVLLLVQTCIQRVAHWFNWTMHLGWKFFSYGGGRNFVFSIFLIPRIVTEHYRYFILTFLSILNSYGKHFSSRFSECITWATLLHRTKSLSVLTNHSRC